MSGAVRAGPSGVLAIDKPEGITSHDVVAGVRRILGTRKVGHAGTLDPMATGLLLIGVGRATRLLGHLARSDKEYLATIRLGVATVTDDATGPVRYRADPERVASLDPVDLHAAVDRLTGRLSQVPCAVSAIKVDGRRAYARVRDGEAVSLVARPIEVTAFEVMSWHRDPVEQAWVDLQVRIGCSTGTYVRALARDLGEDLQVGGHLTRLRRTRIGRWQVHMATRLDDLQGEMGDRLVDLGQAAADCLPVLVVEGTLVEDVRHGRPIALSGAHASVGPLAVLDGGGRLLAIAVADGGRARYLAVLAD